MSSIASAKPLLDSITMIFLVLVHTLRVGLWMVSNITYNLSSSEKFGNGADLRSDVTVLALLIRGLKFFWRPSCIQIWKNFQPFIRQKYSSAKYIVILFIITAITIIIITGDFDGRLRRPLAASKVGCQIYCVLGLCARLDRYFETW